MAKAAQITSFMIHSSDWLAADIVHIGRPLQAAIAAFAAKAGANRRRAKLRRPSNESQAVGDAFDDLVDGCRNLLRGRERSQRGPPH
ncbi:hypothetical protein X759_12615 [Mesorhizobium sp. LSHC420B00]|nr:hypothetical protein X759_12615 [Mesorhizobium sp. LSHC420B00]